MVRIRKTYRICFVSRFATNRHISFFASGSEKASLFEECKIINSLPRTQGVNYVDIEALEPVNSRKSKTQSIVQKPPVDTGPRVFEKTEDFTFDEMVLDELFQDQKDVFQSFYDQEDSKSQHEGDFLNPFSVRCIGD